MPNSRLVGASSRSRPSPRTPPTVHRTEDDDASSDAEPACGERSSRRVVEEDILLLYFKTGHVYPDECAEGRNRTIP